MAADAKPSGLSAPPAPPPPNASGLICCPSMGLHLGLVDLLGVKQQSKFELELQRNSKALRKVSESDTIYHTDEWV